MPDHSLYSRIENNTSLFLCNHHCYHNNMCDVLMGLGSSYYSFFFLRLSLDLILSFHFFFRHDCLESKTPTQVSLKSRANFFAWRRLLVTSNGLLLLITTLLCCKCRALHSTRSTGHFSCPHSLEEFMHLYDAQIRIYII